MMANYICKTCGVQYQDSKKPPAHCPICEDERQYIGSNGQEWTTPEKLRKDHINEIRFLEQNLYGIGTSPTFAIGQRALLVCSRNGNVLWDCISLIDKATLLAVNKLGGISAIAISHPHFYDSMVDWSHAFNAPIYLHENDRQWVMRTDPNIVFWDGEKHLLSEGLTLIRCDGHFPGSSVLHWRDGAEGRGVLLSGDTLQVVPDRKHVSFMYSYPNLIPLPQAKIMTIIRAIDDIQYDRIYGGWWDRVIENSGKLIVQVSAQRYIAAIGASAA
jgi:hypothetical protein